MNNHSVPENPSLLEVISETMNEARESRGFPVHEVRYEVQTDALKDLNLLGVPQEFINEFDAFRTFHPIGDLSYGPNVLRQHFNKFDAHDYGHQPHGLYVEGRGLYHRGLPLRVGGEYVQADIYFKGIGGYEYVLGRSELDYSKLNSRPERIGGLKGIPSSFSYQHIFRENIHYKFDQGECPRIMGLAETEDIMLEYCLGIALLSELITREPKFSWGNLEGIVNYGVPFPFMVASLHGMKEYIWDLLDRTDLHPNILEWYKSFNVDFGVLGINTPGVLRNNNKLGVYAGPTAMGETLRYLHMYGLVRDKTSNHAQNYYVGRTLCWADLADTNNMGCISDDRAVELMSRELSKATNHNLAGPELKDTIWRSQFFREYFAQEKDVYSHMLSDRSAYPFDREKAISLMQKTQLLMHKYGFNKAFQLYCESSESA